MDYISKFIQDSFQVLGVEISSVVADGKIHRFSTNKKIGDDSGWYVLFDGEFPAGAFGDWRRGISEKWTAKDWKDLSIEDKKKFAERMRKIEETRTLESENQFSDMRKKVIELMKSNSINKHPYLDAKKINLLGSAKIFKSSNGKETLIIPMQNESGVCGAQLISPDGSKKFLPGSRAKGAWFLIPGRSKGVICLAEGYATAVSIHEATGNAVAVCFSCGNILPAANIIKKKFKDSKIIICADDDYMTSGNPGIREAAKTAGALKCEWIKPVWRSGRGEKDTDFNDLALSEGLLSVKKCFERQVNKGPVLIRPMEKFDDLFDICQNGFESGIGMGYPLLDKNFRVAKGFLNIVTGIPSHGKSEVMDQLLLNISVNHQWKTLFFSPENNPVELHLRKLCEKYLKKTMLKTGTSKEEIWEAAKIIDDYFRLVDCGENELKLEDVLNYARNGDYDNIVIDPWNELDLNRPKHFSDHEWIGKKLAECRRFARKYEVAFWIVAHPTKMRKDYVTGKTPVPTLYDVNGSSHFYNKADNGFVVWRDFEEEYVSLIIQKVKFRYYGNAGFEMKFKYEKNGGYLIPYTGW